MLFRTVINIDIVSCWPRMTGPFEEHNSMSQETVREPFQILKASIQISLVGDRIHVERLWF
jgi:hypothetical protein